MSQENVETVRHAIASADDRDIDRYLAYCTADVLARLAGCSKALKASVDSRPNSTTPAPISGSIIDRLEPVGSHRLVGDGDANRLDAGPGRDWLSGEGGRDRLYTRDGQIDTVKCGDVEDEYVMDGTEERLGC